MKNKYLKPLIFIVCVISIIILNWYDLDILGPGLTFTLIYLIPIAVVSWFSGVFYGVAIGTLCSFSWLNIYIANHAHTLVLNNMTIENIFIKFFTKMSSVGAGIAREFHKANSPLACASRINTAQATFTFK